MIISRSVLLKMRNVSDKTCRESQNTIQRSKRFFSENRAVCQMMWKNEMEPEGHRWQYNMAHTLFMLKYWGYRHTIRICNTYCFPTAKMVRRTRLDITLCLRCLPYSFWTCQTEFSLPQFVLFGEINVPSHLLL